jgi:hypothetical protein
MQRGRLKLVRTQIVLRVFWGTDQMILEQPAGPHKTSGQCSTLALERQINEMADAIEKYTSASEQRQKATDDTLMQILATMDRLALANQSTALHTPFASPVPAETKPYLSNPTPTSELTTIVFKVVSEARSCVGKRKGGADDNSCQVSIVLNLIMVFPLIRNI